MFAETGTREGEIENRDGENGIDLPMLDSISTHLYALVYFYSRFEDLFVSTDGFFLPDTNSI